VEGCCSDWRTVTNAVPPGSVLGTLLLVICIRDLDENVQSMINGFANDTQAVWCTVRKVIRLFSRSLIIWGNRPEMVTGI